MKVNFIYKGEENLGVQHISSVLKENGHDTELMFDSGLFSEGDSNYIKSNFLKKLFNKQEEIIKEITKEKFCIIAFSVVTDDYQWACKLAKKIKHKTNFPIVFGGIHPTSVPEKVIKNGFVDFVVVGEGEYAMLDLVNAIEKKQRYNIKNVWYKKNGKIIKNSIRPPINDLDKLPFPDKDLFYNKAPYLQRRYRIMTKRGCPNSCTYCCNNVLRGIYCDGQYEIRERSPENVIEELKIAKEKYKIERIFFGDDNFISSKEWLEKFLEMYKKDINIPFGCIVIPGFLNEDNIKQLKEAGCMRIKIGVQTTNEDLKRRILKRYDSNEQILNIAKLIHKYKVKLYVDHLFGIPGETIKDYIDAVKFYNKVRPTQITKFWLVYYPKAEIINTAVEKGILTYEDIEKIEEGKYPHSTMDRKDKTDADKFLALLGILPLLPKSTISFILNKKLYNYLPSGYLFHHVFMRLVQMIFFKDIRDGFKIILSKQLYFIKKRYS